MNRNLRVWAVAVLVVLLAAIAVLCFFNRERWKDYRDYFREDHVAVEMQYDKLTSATDEKAARKLFPNAFLRCYDDSSAPRLGDHVCYSTVTHADGLPAMSVLLFFAKGKLTHTMVRVPWWAHGAWRDKLVGQYGVAHRSTTFSMLEGPMVQWDLAGGAYINFHRERSLNPLEWSGIFFTPGEPPAPPPAPASTPQPEAQAVPEAPVAAPAAVTSAPKLPMPIL